MTAKIAYRRALAAAAVLLAAATTASVAAAQQKHPVYVGAAVCAKCHSGAGMGYQHSKWLLSKHAEAFASLSLPEARQIARLSGVPIEPQKSPLCLGCHATAVHVEDWEKDPAFAVENGVQCEKCHGPGSEYIDERIMRNRQLAIEAGLILPKKDDCMGCHAVKGSHVAVLRQPAFDPETAWQQIAHPTPEPYDYHPQQLLPEPADTSPAAPKYTGSLACAACHQGPAMGYQFSKWRLSAHARAYAVLATPEAYQIAKQSDVKGSPQLAEQCLRCHTTAYHDPAGGFLESYSLFEGVGCEACHGPGSEYSPEAVMTDPKAAQMAGLRQVTRETCLHCHADAHGKPFDYEEALAAIAHPTHLPPPPDEVRYKNPLNMALSPDGTLLLVACEMSDTVAVIDVAARRKVGEIPVGGQPNDLAFSPDGLRAYVSNRLDDTVAVLHVAARKVLQTIPIGDEPHGLLTDPSGKLLYVLNTSSDDISVIDTGTMHEIKRLAASRNPWSLALSPDGKQIYVTNALSRFVQPRTPSMSEVTVVDTTRAVIADRIVVPAGNLLMGVAWHPSGRFALVTLNRTKNLVPMTRLLQGWTITNALAVIWADGRVDQVLLDEPTMCFPDPTDVAVTPDGRLALVTSSGSDRVAVVDIEALLRLLEKASPQEREHVLPNHLGVATEYVVKHIPTGRSPRGVVIARDGRTAFVADCLDDSVTVIDLSRLEATGRIDLGGPQVITKARRGERLFHSAGITFHRQFSCHTCHPDGHVDGITYDIEPDGIGVSPVDNRTLRGILDTAPFKWEGTNPSLSRQCGPRLAVFFTRIQPFTPEELSAVDEYIATIPRPPNRYRPLGAELTDAQRRGKAIFYRTRTNDGRELPEEKRCSTCHFPPLFTDRRRHDVGTQMPLDVESRFDTPHLNNIYDSAPYLHNGSAPTLEEIWTRYNPYDQHGVTNDLTKDQLNDLVEYLKTL